MLRSPFLGSEKLGTPNLWPAQWADDFLNQSTTSLSLSRCSRGAVVWKVGDGVGCSCCATTTSSEDGHQLSSLSSSSSTKTTTISTSSTSTPTATATKSQFECLGRASSRLHYWLLNWVGLFNRIYIYIDHVLNFSKYGVCSNILATPHSASRIREAEDIEVKACWIQSEDGKYQTWPIGATIALNPFLSKSWLFLFRLNWQCWIWIPGAMQARSWC